MGITILGKMKMKNTDAFFMSITEGVSHFSKCFSRKIGAILVSNDKIIISTGYNGPPRGVPHCDSPIRHKEINRLMPQIKDPIPKNKCPRKFLGFASGEGLFLCPAAHAERNCIINAARSGISTLNSTLYLNTTFPCKECCIEIVNAGIIRVVSLIPEFYDDMGKWILEQAGIEMSTCTIEVGG